MEDRDGLDISSVIRRAQEAIEKAKRLTRLVESGTSAPDHDENADEPNTATNRNELILNENSTSDERGSHLAESHSLHGNSPNVNHNEHMNEQEIRDDSYAQALRLRAFLRLQLLTSQEILTQLQTQQHRAEDLSMRLSAIIGPRSQGSASSSTSYWWLSASRSANVAPTETEPGTREPERSSVSAVAERLAVLGAQQSSTLQQLLNLRLEQLRLRQQQLSALQELLRSEAVLIQQPTPLQLSAVYQSLSLLSQSLDDMRLASAAIEAGSGALTHGTAGEESTESLLSSLGSGGVLAETVASADRRAEHVALMARQLLMVLREFPRQTSDSLSPNPLQPVPLRGCDEIQLSSLPSAIVCFPSPFAANEDPQARSSGPIVRISSGGGKSVALAGEACGICLSEFQAGEVLRSCDGETHFFHPACLFEWLRIRASCPTCRHFVP